MKVLVLTEGSRPNEIGYHFTDLNGLKAILDSNTMLAVNRPVKEFKNMKYYRKTEKEGGYLVPAKYVQISKWNKDRYEQDENGNPKIITSNAFDKLTKNKSWSYTRSKNGMFYRSFDNNKSPIRIDIDIDKITEKQGNPIPFTWTHAYKSGENFEFEERFAGDTPNFRQYIKGISFRKGILDKAMKEASIILDYINFEKNPTDYTINHLYMIDSKLSNILVCYNPFCYLANHVRQTISHFLYSIKDMDYDIQAAIDNMNNNKKKTSEILVDLYNTDMLKELKNLKIVASFFKTGDLEDLTKKFLCETVNERVNFGYSDKDDGDTAINKLLKKENIKKLIGVHCKLFTEYLKDIPITIVDKTGKEVVKNSKKLKQLRSMDLGAVINKVQGDIKTILDKAIEELKNSSKIKSYLEEYKNLLKENKGFQDNIKSIIKLSNRIDKQLERDSKKAMTLKQIEKLKDRQYIALGILVKKDEKTGNLIDISPSERSMRLCLINTLEKNIDKSKKLLSTHNSNLKSKFTYFSLKEIKEQLKQKTLKLNPKTLKYINMLNQFLKNRNYITKEQILKNPKILSLFFGIASIKSIKFTVPNSIGTVSVSKHEPKVKVYNTFDNFKKLISKKTDKAGKTDKTETK